MPPTPPFLRFGVHRLAPEEVIRQEVEALTGVNAGSAALLHSLNVATVFDLATSFPFQAAAAIARAAEGENPELATDGIVAAHAVDGAVASASPQELAGRSPEVLRGISSEKAAALREWAGIETVHDMGVWPPYQEARRFLRRVLGTESDPALDPGTPTDLLPGSRRLPSERVYYDAVVLDTVGDQGGLKEIDSPVEVAGSPSGYQLPLRGAVLRWEQSWYREGLALGRLLHSIALAPGESTRLAVIDWRREERGESEETTSQRERLAAATSQQRGIQEVASAVATELQTGSSYTRTDADMEQGGGSSGMIGQGSSGGYAYGWSAASTHSVSTGERAVSARLSQNIRHSTQQNATSARSRRAAVVREVSQSEREEISTRIVTNYNHMHALTVQYHEVLQVYRTMLRVEKVERALFIPFKPFDFSDATVIHRHRDALAAAALDPYTRDLIRATSALFDVAFTATRAHELAFEDEPTYAMRKQRARDRAKRIARLKATFRMAAGRGLVAFEGFPYTEWRMPATTRLINAEWSGTRVTALTVGLGAGAKLEVESPGSDPGAIHPDLDPAPDVQAITTIGLQFAEADHDDAQTLKLHFRTDAGINFSLHCDVVLPKDRDRLELLRISKPEQTGELATRLNANALHYSQAVWLSMPGSEFSAILATRSYQGEPLADYIDPQPLAVAGNAVAFRWFAVDKDWEEWRSRHVQDEVHEELITLPTGGVFGEAVLGRSNAAEKLDLTRFWNWQDSPIPLPPPEIAAITAGSRQSTADLSGAGLESPLVQQVAPGSLPDPQGMAAVVSALTSANMFRDMSGAALSAAMAQNALQAAAAGARSASEQSNRAMEIGGGQMLDLARLAAEVGTGLMGGGSVSKAGGVLNKLAEAAGGAASGTGSAGEAASPAIDAGAGGGTSGLTPQELGQAALRAMGVAPPSSGRSGDLDTASAPMRELFARAAEAGEFQFASRTGDSAVELSARKGGGTRPFEGSSASVKQLVDLGGRTAEALSGALGTWRSDPEAELSVALQDALLEFAAKELKKQGTALAKRIPLGHGLVIGAQLSLAMAEGIGRKLQEVNRTLQEEYDALERSIDFDADGLSEEEIEALRTLSGYQHVATKQLRPIFASGISAMGAKAFELGLDTAKKVFGDAVNQITRAMAENDELLALVADSVEEGRKGIPTQRWAVEERLLAFAFRAYLKQLDDGGFKSALKEIIEPVRGADTVVVDLAAGVAQALLDGGITELRSRAGIEQMLLLKGKALLTEVTDAGYSVSAAADGHVEVHADELRIPQSVLTRINMAAGTPDDASLEMADAASAFLAVKLLESARLKQSAFALQRQVNRGGLPFDDARDQNADINMDGMRTIATAWENLKGTVRRIGGAGDPGLNNEGQLVELLEDRFFVTEQVEFFEVVRPIVGGEAVPQTRGFAASAFIHL